MSVSGIKNVRLGGELGERVERLARTLAVAEDAPVTASEVIRRAVQEFVVAREGAVNE